MALDSDERALLGVLAAADGPLGMHDAAVTLNPFFTGRPQPHRWRDRQQELTRAFVRLHQHGYIHEVLSADGFASARYALTELGRASV